MLLSVALLISAAMVVFVVNPLLSAKAEGPGTLPVDVTPVADLKHRRLVLYENIKDLEFEYRAKKISREDYEALRRDYTAEAARLMTASQELGRSSPEDALIEREVAARRARRKPPISELYICSKCGFENPVPVKFCGECGAKIGKS